MAKIQIVTSNSEALVRNLLSESVPLLKGNPYPDFNYGLLVLQVFEFDTNEIVH